LEAALRHSPKEMSGNMAFPGSPLNVTIVRPPKGLRAIGVGEKWNLMLTCLYHWGGEDFVTWIVLPSPKPLEARIQEADDEMRKLDKGSDQS